MVITGTGTDQVLYRVACRRATKLINASRRAHLASLVESSDTNLRQLWTTVNGLLHPPLPATDFPPDWSQSVADFFMAKVTNIKQQAAALTSQLTSDPLPSSVPVDTQLNTLSPVTAEEVRRLLSKTADKSSALDVIPTWLLKRHSDTLSQLIAELANISFKTGTFQTEFKFALVTPILKKPSFSTDNTGSYHPISNLNSISKILEMLVLARITSHISRSACENVDSCQSAYVPRRSTETSLLRAVHALNDRSRPHSSSALTSRPHSIALITRFFCVDWKPTSGWEAARCRGSTHF